MNAKRPSRFGAWQEQNQVRREGIIDEYLHFLSKTKVRVRNPTDLAELVAKHLSHVEGAPCNRSTLLRNVRYKVRLLNFQANRLAAGSSELNPRAVTDPTAKALMTRSQLETGNLKRELERLNIYVASLEEQVDQHRSQGRRAIGPVADGGAAAHVLEAELRFLRTCQALRALVSHLNIIVELDVRNQRILDRSKRRDNVIVDKDVAGPFFDWLARLVGSEA